MKGSKEELKKRKVDRNSFLSFLYGLEMEKEEILLYVQSFGFFYWVFCYRDQYHAKY